MFAACFAIEDKRTVEVLEKQDTAGNKLILTGHGRCNILNLKTAQELKSCYHGKGNFLYPALAGFPPSNAYVFIEEVLGIKLTEEDNGRIFPVSGKARDVRDTLVKFIGEENIRYGFAAVSLSRDEDSGIWTVRAEDGREGYYRNVILAAGGKSFPKTGSDGDSYRIAKDLGHDIVEPVAALAPVRIKGRDRTGIPAGLTVKGCVAAILEGDKVISRTEGDVLFTHEGLSGPAIMELARGVKEGTKIKVDFAPNLTDRELTEAMDLSPTKRFINVLSCYVPASLAESAVLKAGAEADITCAKTSREIRRRALGMIREFTAEAGSSPDIETAYVTAGGVNVSEVNRKTMESKICPGLFILGDALDCDGISGGYNLTACIAEAKLACGSLRI